jgi:3-hydroxyisobutyrate dehydrogenase-like beta-hydroxyacid dehydrogenase
MTQIAVLGLGAMGSRMAARLLAAGHAVNVWNRDPQRALPLSGLGATLAASPRAAATGAGIVLAMVRDDAASRQVWLDPASGALDAMARGAIAVESSTLTVAHVQALAAEAGRRGIGFVDGPVAGSRPQAEAGQLIFLAGASPDVLDAVRPVLEVLGGAVLRAGAPGAGTALKLAVNALLGIEVAALAELLAVLENHGIGAAAAAELLGQVPVTSPAAKVALASMATGSYAPAFPVDLVAKDFASLAASAPGPLPVASAAAGVFADAIGAGLGAEQLTAVRRLYGG